MTCGYKITSCCNETVTRPFLLCAGDVIHPVLWLVKGPAIARLDYTQNTVLVLIIVMCILFEHKINFGVVGLGYVPDNFLLVHLLSRIAL